MQSVLLYVHDEVGFGHISRMRKIAHSLSPKLRVVVLLWWVEDIYFNDDIEVNYLPHKYVETNTSWWGVDFQSKFKDRNEYITKLLKNNDFLYLLIDSFPFFRHMLLEENDFLIRSFSKKWKKVYTIMRDIYAWIKIDFNVNLLSKIDFKSVSLQDLLNCINENQIQSVKTVYLLKYYLENELIHSVIVFGDKSIHKLEEEFSWVIDKKYFKYMWYILSLGSWLAQSYREENYILISFWGNIFDREKFLKIMYYIKHLKNIKVKVIFWKMLDSTFQNQIKEKFHSENIEFLWFQKDIKNIILWSRLFIWAGWYGTVTDLMCYKKVSILVSNYNSNIQINKTEQETRLQWLSNHLPFIHYVDSVDKDFLSLVTAAFKQEKIKDYELKVDTWGSKNILAFLQK